MKAYKATYNMRCQNITYQVNKTYEFIGDLGMCSQGFRFCKKAKDTLNYYKHNKDFKLLEIEVLGKVINGNDKSITNKFKVLRVIGKSEYLNLLNIKLDENNNLIHCKDSYNNEYWKKYDENNNLIYFKDFRGKQYQIKIIKE